MTAITHSLLHQAREHNLALEQNYLALAVTLHEIDLTEAWKDDFESFVDFYENDLHRERSTVSRLLKVGKWLKENDQLLPTGNISYKRLAQSIQQFPDKDPKYVLAVAQEWNNDDFKAQKKDDCKRHEFAMFCKHCWKKQ